MRGTEFRRWTNDQGSKVSRQSPTLGLPLPAERNEVSPCPTKNRPTVAAAPPPSLHRAPGYSRNPLDDAAAEARRGLRHIDVPAGIARPFGWEGRRTHTHSGNPTSRAPSQTSGLPPYTHFQIAAFEKTLFIAVAIPK